MLKELNGRVCQNQKHEKHTNDSEVASFAPCKITEGKSAVASESSLQNFPSVSG